MWFWFFYLAVGDPKNSIIQWLSRSNTNFSTPKISSSKPHSLVSSVCSIYPVLPLPPHFVPRANVFWGTQTQSFVKGQTASSTGVNDSSTGYGCWEKHDLTNRVEGHITPPHSFPFPKRLITQVRYPSARLLILIFFLFLMSQLHSLNYRYVSRAAMPCWPLRVLPDGGSESILLHSWIPSDVLQVLQQGKYQ